MQNDEGFSRWLDKNVDPELNALLAAPDNENELNALFAAADGADAQPLALPDAAVPVNNPARVVQILQGRGELPEEARAYLIALCHKAIADAAAQVLRVPPGTKLVQCDISNPKPDSGFPHLVKRNGALSDEAEAAVWEQYKTKFTPIKVQLLDAQGAPPPRSYPCEPSGWSPPKAAPNQRRAPCLCRPACPGKHGAAGRREA